MTLSPRIFALPALILGLTLALPARAAQEQAAPEQSTAEAAAEATQEPTAPEEAAAEQPAPAPAAPEQAAPVQDAPAEDAPKAAPAVAEHPAKPVSLPKSKRLPQEININLFRSPSMGLEYRLAAFSIHVGAYPTVISKNAAGENETSWFLRAGITAYFLGHSFYKQRESEFFVSGSYLRGLNLGHENGAAVEVGYRWMVWKGLNVRLGAALLFEPNRDVQVNPTPGIGWSFAF